MKRVLWLVPPQESWMATDCCFQLAPGLRAEGFDIVSPVPPPEGVGRLRLASHYWECLQQPYDLVHAFDRTAALMAMLVRRNHRKICLDDGMASPGRNNLDWFGIPTLSWGIGGSIPWPPARSDGRCISEPHGSFVGLDSSNWAPNIVESVVWSLEIARQVVPHVQLASGLRVSRQPLIQFAHAVGAIGALANVSCEQALADGTLKALVLALPDRRVLELAAVALRHGVRVAWVVDRVSDIEEKWPASDPPLVWRDRTGLARLLLEWGRCDRMPEISIGTSTLIESAKAVADVYRGVLT